jgi:hypothetical protein
MTKDSCQIKCGRNAYKIRALGWLLQLCSYIIGLPFLCVKILYSCYYTFSNIIVFCYVRSGSAQLSFHLLADLLSTIFVSILRPPVLREIHITVYTAVHISHRIILHFIPLDSYWLQEICLKSKLYTLRRQYEERKLIDGRRSRWEDNIKIDVQMNWGPGAYFWIRLVQNTNKFWSVEHRAINLPVPYLLTACVVVDFSWSTVLHAICLFAVHFSEKGEKYLVCCML